MPNPKAGCVVPPNANLKILTERLRKMLHVVAKIQLSAKCSVGRQDMPDDQLVENIMVVYNAVVRGLINEINNIRSLLLKYSMGPVLKVGAEEEEKPAAKAAAPAEAKPEEKKEEPKKTAKPAKADQSNRSSTLPRAKKAETKEVSQ